MTRTALRNCEHQAALRRVLRMLSFCAGLLLCAAYGSANAQAIAARDNITVNALPAPIESMESDFQHPPAGIASLAEAAHQGVPEAGFALGNRYYFGEGIEQNDARAVEWWVRAAENGSARAAYNLGLYFHRHRESMKSIESANHWFSRAAHLGFAEASFALGVIALDTGNETDARDKFLEAAESDLPIAQFNLAVLLERHANTVAQTQEAIRWYKKARDAGLDQASVALARLEGPGSALPSTTENLLHRWATIQIPANYTLQIAAGKSKAAIIKILNGYVDFSEKGYAQIERNGDTSYVALLGSFPTYSAATEFLMSLPDEHANNKPWVRRFSTLNLNVGE